MEFLETISSTINSPDLQARLFWVRVVFMAVGGFLLAGLIFFLAKSNWLYFTMFDVTTFSTFPGLRLRRTGKRWRKIVARLEVADESEYKLAVMEADVMLGDALKQIQVLGPNLDEQLTNISRTIIPNIEELTKAHELRNRLVANPDYQLTLQEARQTLQVYETTFRDAGLIQ